MEGPNPGLIFHAFAGFGDEFSVRLHVSLVNVWVKKQGGAMQEEKGTGLLEVVGKFVHVLVVREESMGLSAFGLRQGKFSLRGGRSPEGY